MLDMTKKAVVVSAMMLLGACTETHIHEASSTSGTQSGTGTVQTTQNSSTSGNGVQLPTSADVILDDPGGVSGSVSDTIAASVVGTPGITADCAFTLPCTALTADSAIAVTLGAIDNTGRLDQLAIDFQVMTDHDTSLSLGATAGILNAAGQTLRVVERSLGGGNGLSPIGVLAGETRDGRYTYDQKSTSSSLNDWEITLNDNGIARTLAFSNMPIGPLQNTDIDCEMTLPCTWNTPDELASITLLSAGGMESTGRLGISFQVVTAADMAIVVDGSSIAIDDSGRRYDSRTHSFGADTDYQPIELDILGGFATGGTINFYRNEGTPVYLSSFRLDIYDARPVSRWEPVFHNVPLQ